MKRILPILILLGIAAGALAVNPYMMVLARKNAGGGWNAGLSSDVNLTAWYKFESGAITTDSSGNGNTLTASASSPTSVAGGVDGNRILFDDASAQYLYIVDATDAIIDPTGDFSVIFWCEMDALNDQWPFCRGDSGGSDDAYVGVWYDEPTTGWRLSVGWNAGGSFAHTSSSVTASTGKLYFVCITYDQSETTTTLHVYNVTDSTVAVSALQDVSTTMHSGESGWLGIGTRADDTNPREFWSGYVDELMVFDRLVSTGDRDNIRDGVY